MKWLEEQKQRVEEELHRSFLNTYERENRTGELFAYNRTIRKVRELFEMKPYEPK